MTHAEQAVLIAALAWRQASTLSDRSEASCRLRAAVDRYEMEVSRQQSLARSRRRKVNPDPSTTGVDASVSQSVPVHSNL